MKSIALSSRYCAYCKEIIVKGDEVTAQLRGYVRTGGRISTDEQEQFHDMPQDDSKNCFNRYIVKLSRSSP